MSDSNSWINFSANIVGSTPVFLGPGDDLIVDIGKVTHISNFKALGTQKADNHIKNNHRPGMTDMTTVIDRHPANIDTHLRWMEGGKGFFLLWFGNYIF